MEFASQAQRTWAWLVGHSAIFRRVQRAFRESEEDHTDAGGAGPTSRLPWPP